MNLASVDLNLLVAFEALMEERHVTRAGQRIGLAQPSMSSTLTRLRALFGDELFVRSASGMQPTARALALARPISDALGQIRGVLEPTSAFNPATASHRLSIAATDYGDLVVVPPLVEALRRAAPGIDLVVRPIIDPAASVTSLERGDVDALIGGHLPVSPRVTRCTLFTENFVCIRDAKRAKGKARLTKEDYTRLPHVLFSSAGGDGLPGAIDTMLSRHGRKRRTAITLAHVVAVPFAVAGTDLVATMAERVARRFATAAGVSVVPIPYDVEPFTIDLLHTRRAMADPALRWFIELVNRVCGTL
ncbi:LysR family transcriptional regulator [Bradyrhizobium japonicum]|uniref:LysR family transcriptional regulator n=1 Tax=Bradyrhizobium TaxID=374 RepID=UPI0020105CED|nr:LysR family transcriptional regulator [Bradyrhizobium japonicum]UQD76054.1 LysR family transcriptional regulator [Bradyrhizobium japonicum]WLB51093.1 LysR family transcriptional regulator [Bradyrhizobium japonicum]WLB67133.1 LysR family transcriptional regulator [Bradyrhizobium japonicum]